MANLNAASIRSLPTSAIIKMSEADRDSALGELSLTKKLNTMAQNTGLLTYSGFVKAVYDFIVATVDTPEERAHLVLQVELALDKYLSPKFGGKDSQLYKEIKALTLTLIERLLKTIGGNTEPVAHASLAAAKTSFGIERSVA